MYAIVPNAYIIFNSMAEVIVVASVCEVRAMTAFGSLIVSSLNRPPHRNYYVCITFTIFFCAVSVFNLTMPHTPAR